MKLHSGGSLAEGVNAITPCDIVPILNILYNSDGAITERYQSLVVVLYNREGGVVLKGGWEHYWSIVPYQKNERLIALAILDLVKLQ